MKTNGSNATQVATTTPKPGTLGEWLSNRKDVLKQALPANTVNVDRFMQSAALAITNPKMPNLRLCSKDSIFRALKEAASYGLELNGTLGQAYLIPYNESVQVNGKYEKQMTAHFQMGYKGLIALARRSNTIKTIAAEPVYENDIFDVQLGMGRSLSHKIDIMKERGEIVGYYCLVELCNGGTQFKVMSKKDVENHRNKFSKAYDPKDENNIWNKNFDAMALKTVVIQALKLCPISIEAMDAVLKEEKKDIDEEISTDYTIVDFEPEDVIDNPAPAIEDKSVKTKTEKQQPEKEHKTFDESNAMTPEEESLAEQAFEAAQNNVNDIF